MFVHLPSEHSARFGKPDDSLLKSQQPYHEPSEYGRVLLTHSQLRSFSIFPYMTRSNKLPLPSVLPDRNSKHYDIFYNHNHHHHHARV